MNNTTPITMRAAIYARVSTLEQNCDNQLIELRRYVEARGWTGTEFVDPPVPIIRETTSPVR